MPSLQVRELPQQIYLKLQEMASLEHRSLAQEAIVVLARGLGLAENPQERRHKLIRDLRTKPIVKDGFRYSDPALLIREDRER